MRWDEFISRADAEAAVEDALGLQGLEDIVQEMLADTAWSIWEYC